MTKLVILSDKERTIFDSPPKSYVIAQPLGHN
jgi:hypothetical protein